MLMCAQPLFASRWDEIAARLERDGERREMKHAVLYFQRGSVSPRDADAFAALFDKGVNDIERFTGIHRAPDAPRIAVYVARRMGISRTFPHPQPRMFFDAARIRDHDAPYLHETVHAVAGDGGTMWLEEGFAEYVASAVADQFGGYYAPILSDDNDHVDAQAREVADDAGWLMEHRPDLRDSDTRTNFYIVAHSFTKFLGEKLGVRKLAAIHRANDPSALTRSTGRSLSSWRAEWRAGLGTGTR
ncbi:MAG TPA: hypothetical protein VMU84_07360 [Thermoanaerobaculia bacterium]|nr:hypothetical protein [Thermoanaerobaculia bacterium]